MTAIRKHMISAKANVPFYKREDMAQIKAFLPKGIWIGIINAKNELLYVLTTLGKGWIRAEDVKEITKDHFTILQDDLGEIHYGVQ